MRALLEQAHHYDPHERQERYLPDEQPDIRGQLSAGLEREMVLLWERICPARRRN